LKYTTVSVALEPGGAANPGRTRPRAPSATASAMPGVSARVHDRPRHIETLKSSRLFVSEHFCLRAFGKSPHGCVTSRPADSQPGVPAGAATGTGPHAKRSDPGDAARIRARPASCWRRCDTAIDPEAAAGGGNRLTWKTSAPAPRRRRPRA
jgi:hypothetical protein